MAQIDARSNVVVGIDIGGSKIAFMVNDLDSGDVWPGTKLTRQMTPIPERSSNCSSEQFGV